MFCSHIQSVESRWNVQNSFYFIFVTNARLNRIENRNIFNMRSVGGRARGLIRILYCRNAIDCIINRFWMSDELGINKLRVTVIFYCKRLRIAYSRIFHSYTATSSLSIMSVTLDKENEWSNATDKNKAAWCEIKKISAFIKKLVTKRTKPRNESSIMSIKINQWHWPYFLEKLSRHCTRDRSLT